MSEANVDAAFDYVTHALSREDEFALAQKILGVNPSGEHKVELTELETPTDAETMRRQREALDRVRGMCDGPEDLAVRHDECLYGQGKP